MLQASGVEWLCLHVSEMHCAGRFAAGAYLAGYNCMTERELRMTCGVVL